MHKVDVFSYPNLNYFEQIPIELVTLVCKEILLSEGYLLAWKAPQSSFPFVCKKFCLMYKDMRFQTLLERILGIQGSKEVVAKCKDYEELPIKEKYAYLYHQINLKFSPHLQAYYIEQTVHHAMKTLLHSFFSEKFQDDFNRLKKMIEAGAFVNAVTATTDNKTPLLQFCFFVSIHVLGQKCLQTTYVKTSNRALEILDYLLDVGADPNHVGTSTPLMTILGAQPASTEDTTLTKEMIKRLIKAGADPKQTVPGFSFFRRTPLEYARKNYPVMLEVLEGPIEGK